MGLLDILLDVVHRGLQGCWSRAIFRAGSTGLMPSGA